MIALTIWRAAILLESVVLYRGFRTRLVSKYPFFYSYIASVLLADGSFYFVHMMSAGLYAKWNWAATLLNLILGYGVILEVFRHALEPYPGVERATRMAGLGIFALIFGFAVVFPLVTSATARVSSTVQLERDFWAVQTIFLVAAVSVLAYYGIVMGRNLQGIVLGYGLCLATTLMALALRSYFGASFRRISNFIEPFSFLISLLIWNVTLWSDDPESVAEPSGRRLETDYESLAQRTRSVMGTMRARLARVARP